MSGIEWTKDDIFDREYMWVGKIHLATVCPAEGCKIDNVKFRARNMLTREWVCRGKNREDAKNIVKASVVAAVARLVKAMESTE